MEKEEGHRLFQKKEIKLKQPVDWSFQSYKDDISSDEDNTEEPMARWIVKKKKKWLRMENEINKLSGT